MLSISKAVPPKVQRSEGGNSLNIKLSSGRLFYARDLSSRIPKENKTCDSVNKENKTNPDANSVKLLQDIELILKQEGSVTHFCEDLHCRLYGGENKGEQLSETFSVDCMEERTKGSNSVRICK